MVDGHCETWKNFLAETANTRLHLRAYPDTSRPPLSAIAHATRGNFLTCSRQGETTGNTFYREAPRLARRSYLSTWRLRWISNPEKSQRVATFILDGAM